MKDCKSNDPWFNSNPENLFATGDSNWNLYVASVHADEPKKTYLVAIAKEGSGAGNSCFGDLRHIVSLIRDGYFSDTFTAYGRKLMQDAGYGDVVAEFERIKTWQVDFYDSYSVYGKLLRREYIKANCYAKAKDIARNMQQNNEKSNYVLPVKYEANRFIVAA